MWSPYQRRILFFKTNNSESQLRGYGVYDHNLVEHLISNIGSNIGVLLIKALVSKQAIQCNKQLIVDPFQMHLYLFLYLHVYVYLCLLRFTLICHHPLSVSWSYLLDPFRSIFMVEMT
ncbi:hypothetical protein ABFX02_05G083900 [Erythranthe guttata]